MARAQLSMVFGGVSGATQGVVAVRGRSGLVLQAPKRFKRAISADQRLAMARMAQAGKAWELLSDEQAAAWRDYAAGLTHHNHLTGETYAPLAFNVFCGLAAKVLQIDAEAAIPGWPPATAFPGDDLVVTAAAGTGQITYTASAANSAGVMTELLYQVLPGRHRVPKPAYKSAGFVAFSGAGATFDLPVSAGYYACAYRFVRPATGQMTGFVALGSVTVF